jgi:hypothetical protein
MMNEAHWMIQPQPLEAGTRRVYRLILMGGNGEEIMRAMTLYNDKRDALHAAGIAQRAQVIVEVDEQGDPA